MSRAATSTRGGQGQLRFEPGCVLLQLGHCNGRGHGDEDRAADQAEEMIRAIMLESSLYLLHGLWRGHGDEDRAADQADVGVERRRVHQLLDLRGEPVLGESRMRSGGGSSSKCSRCTTKNQQRQGGGEHGRVHALFCSSASRNGSRAEMTWGSSAAVFTHPPRSNAMPRGCHVAVKGIQL